MKTLAISFIDYGDVRGTFCLSLAQTLLSIEPNYKVTHAIRWSGSNIPLNRHSVMKSFLSDTDAEWLLCIDTDIIFQAEDVNTLMESVSEDIQVLSGVYFIFRQIGNELKIIPAFFTKLGKEFELDGEAEAVTFFEKNQIQKITRAGFGFLLLSRKVIEQIYSDPAIQNPFMERISENGQLVGEDFMFFEHLEKLGIPCFVHTGVLLKHEKMVAIQKSHFDLSWASKHEGSF